MLIQVLRAIAPNELLKSNEKSKIIFEINATKNQYKKIKITTNTINNS